MSEDESSGDNRSSAQRPRMSSSELKRVMRRLPDRSNRPVLNLDLELFGRNNVVIAVFVVLSALIHGNPEQQKEILERLKPNYLLGPNLIYSFLYNLIVEDLLTYGNIDIPSVVKRIPDFGPEVYGEPSNRRSLQGDYANFAQILDLRPTPIQVTKAIEMVEKYAITRAWADMDANSNNDNERQTI